MGRRERASCRRSSRPQLTSSFRRKKSKKRKIWYPNRRRQDASQKKKFGVVSQADKIAQRKDRFKTSKKSNPAGINMSEDAMAKRRARFGVVETAPILTEAKKRKRMERFGMKDENERLAKRVKRFGSNLDVVQEVKNPAFADKIAKRRAKFGVVDEEAKLKSRKARFASSELDAL